MADTRTSTPLVALDMAGTTVVDDGIVLTAFDSAASGLGLEPGTPRWDEARQYVVDTMGQSKIVVFRHIFGNDDDAARANELFEKSYSDSISTVGVTPVDGAAEAVGRIRETGARVVLTTGFSARTQTALIEKLGWGQLVDGYYCPADVGGRGRPFPDMILRAALDNEVDDIRDVVVVGDTASDMLSGVRSGARRIVGVRSGAHDEAQLREGGATATIESVATLPEWLAGS